MDPIIFFAKEQILDARVLKDMRSVVLVGCLGI